MLIEARSSRDLPSPLAPEVPVLLRLNMTERGGVFTNDAGHWSINWVKQVHGAERLPWTLFCFSSCFFFPRTGFQRREVAGGDAGAGLPIVQELPGRQERALRNKRAEACGPGFCLQCAVDS